MRSRRAVVIPQRFIILQPPCGGWGGAVIVPAGLPKVFKDGDVIVFPAGALTVTLE